MLLWPRLTKASQRSNEEGGAVMRFQPTSHPTNQPTNQLTNPLGATWYTRTRSRRLISFVLLYEQADIQVSAYKMTFSLYACLPTAWWCHLRHAADRARRGRACGTVQTQR